MRKGFTLIELLVVISIIGLLAATGLATFSSAQKRARDVRRKADIHAIYTALEMYHAANGMYPQAGTCAYGASCYVYSTAGSSWIPALVPDYMKELPLDPKIPVVRRGVQVVLFTHMVMLRQMGSHLILRPILKIRAILIAVV